MVRDEQCRAVSGTWFSPYDDRTLTAAPQVDIDHIVPLANAWRLGADTWDTATRKAFANDLGNPQLIAVPAASNRSKGDQSPDRWSPPVARLLVHVLLLAARTCTSEFPGSIEVRTSR